VLIGLLPVLKLVAAIVWQIAFSVDGKIRDKRRLIPRIGDASLLQRISPLTARS
jgi:hypothetical protein